MIAREGVWGEVQPGVYVREPTSGTTWRVDGVDRMTGLVTMTARGGEVASLVAHPRSPVTILEPTEAEAVSTVNRVLGPVEIL